MKNSSRNHNADEITLINIDGGKLHYIAKHILKIDFKALSPFANQPEGGIKPDDSDKELIEDDEFHKMVEVLAKPCCKISFRQGALLQLIQVLQFMRGKIKTV